MSRPVLSVSVTETGRARAWRLPFEHVHGSVAATVRERWGSVEGFVLFLATGAAVRIVAPLLTDKNRDPAVVCIDEGGRHAVEVHPLEGMTPAGRTILEISYWTLPKPADMGTGQDRRMHCAAAKENQDERADPFSDTARSHGLPIPAHFKVPQQARQGKRKSL